MSPDACSTSTGGVASDFSHRSAIALRKKARQSRVSHRKRLKWLIDCKTGAPTTESSETHGSKSASKEGRFCGHFSRGWSAIVGLCAEISSSGPLWRARLRQQKSRSKLELGMLNWLRDAEVVFAYRKRSAAEVARGGWLEVITIPLARSCHVICRSQAAHGRASGSRR